MRKNCLKIKRICNVKNWKIECRQVDNHLSYFLCSPNYKHHNFVEFSSEYKNLLDGGNL